jgi:hypothetical protein
MPKEESIPSQGERCRVAWVRDQHLLWMISIIHHQTKQWQMEQHKSGDQWHDDLAPVGEGAIVIFYLLSKLRQRFVYILWL